MNEKKHGTDPLFREEALREFASARTRGRLLRISPTWQGWVFWVIVATLASGLAFVAVVPVDAWISGEAVVIEPIDDERIPHLRDGATRIAAAFPAERRDQLSVGQPMLLRFEGRPEPLVLEVESIEPGLLGPAEVRSRVGPAGDMLRIDGRVTLVYASQERQAGPGGTEAGGVEAGRTEPGGTATDRPAPEFRAGELARAEVRVGRQTLLEALRPGKDR